MVVEPARPVDGSLDTFGLSGATGSDATEEPDELPDGALKMVVVEVSFLRVTVSQKPSVRFLHQSDQ